MFLRFTRKAFDEIDLDKTGRADYKEARFLFVQDTYLVPLPLPSYCCLCYNATCVSIHVYDFTTGVHWYTQDL
jgi:hypothetical protein